MRGTFVSVCVCVSSNKNILFAEYNCHGSWTENSTVFIIAKHVGSQHGVCISYRPLEGNSVRLVVGDGCHRGTLPPPDHHLTANLTVRGKTNCINNSFDRKSLEIVRNDEFTMTNQTVRDTLVITIT